MLKELTIKNFAIIDDLSVSFTTGLTVMSGETGAGKSIIINAVNLILGTRASSKLIRSGEEAAEIEAFFTISDKSPAARLLKKNDLASDNDLLIRRIISKNDRHRVYINGSMATMQMLSEITENLASISGQHAHQGLLKEDRHLLFLDQAAALIPLREKTAEKYSRLVSLLDKYKKLKASEKNRADQVELLSFQKAEIEAAALEPGEDAALEQERERLKNSEFLLSSARQCRHALYHMEGSVSEVLHTLRADLEKAAGIDSGLSPSLGEMEDLIYRIEDLSGTLRDYENGIETDGSRLETVGERIDLINRLKRKYGDKTGTISGVLEYCDTISKNLAAIENLSEEIGTAEKKLTEIHAEVSEISEQLSQKRIIAAVKLSKKIETELSDLEMGGTRFQVALSPTVSDNNDKWLSAGNRQMTESGTDKAVFMIAPNVGEDMKPLAKTASGGELSRIILALKAILARNESTGTIVFDEVDAGIGGATAEVVGKKIRELAEIHQVICITHLPQIAKFADRHYKIEKQVNKGRTSTSIAHLNETERVAELARMLGGVKITDATLNHAREMIKEA